MGPRLQDAIASLFSKHLSKAQEAPILKCDTFQKKLNGDTGLGIKVLSQE